MKEVRIGNQIWMAENLIVDGFRNGVPVPHAESVEEWINATNELQPAWCYYDNDRGNGKIYGMLYNWYAVIDKRNLAPEGWRLPYYEDWKKLVNFLGGEGYAGGLLKKKGTTHWKSPNTGATNESGFAALPGGLRANGGSFYDKGLNGLWWCADEFSIERAFSWTMYHDTGSVLHFNKPKELGLSVRCIRE